MLWYSQQSSTLQVGKDMVEEVVSSFSGGSLQSGMVGTWEAYAACSRDPVASQGTDRTPPSFLWGLCPWVKQFCLLL